MEHIGAFIRGGLGNQVINYLAAREKARQKGKKISTIFHSTGYFHGVNMEFIQTDWLSKLFKLNEEIYPVNGLKKQNIWQDPVLFRSIIENIEAIKPTLLRPIKFHNQPILHVRSDDSAVATIDNFIELAHLLGPECGLIGNNSIFIEQLIKKIGFGTNVSGDPVADWHLLLGAPSIGAAFSAFPLSAFLFDSDKKVICLSKNKAQGRAKKSSEAYHIIESVFETYFENFRYH